MNQEGNDPFRVQPELTRICYLRILTGTCALNQKIKIKCGLAVRSHNEQITSHRSRDTARPLNMEYRAVNIKSTRWQNYSEVVWEVSSGLIVRSIILRSKPVLWILTQSRRLALPGDLCLLAALLLTRELARQQCQTKEVERPEDLFRMSTSFTFAARKAFERLADRCTHNDERQPRMLGGVGHLVQAAGVEPLNVQAVAYLSFSRQHSANYKCQAKQSNRT